MLLRYTFGIKSMSIVVRTAKVDVKFELISEARGHLPRKGVWGCVALKTPFSRLSCSSQGSHFKQKCQFTRPPFEKIWNFRIYSLNLCLNLALKPQIWKFSAHKPPNLEIFSSQAPSFRSKYQFASLTLWKSGLHTPTWKKLSAPRNWKCVCGGVWGGWCVCVGGVWGCVYYLLYYLFLIIEIQHQ